MTGTVQYTIVAAGRNGSICAFHSSAALPQRCENEGENGTGRQQAASCAHQAKRAIGIPSRYHRSSSRDPDVPATHSGRRGPTASCPDARSRGRQTGTYRPPGCASRRRRCRRWLPRRLRRIKPELRLFVVPTRSHEQATSESAAAAPAASKKTQTKFSPTGGTESSDDGLVVRPANVQPPKPPVLWLDPTRAWPPCGCALLFLGSPPRGCG